MSSTCSTSISGWEDVHCQTSRFDIDKQSCPRALQPHVNTHSLDPSSAWGCTKQASTGACSFARECEHDGIPEDSRNNFVARAGCRWSASKLKGSPARWTINPPLGAPKRLPPPELAPAQNSDMVRTKHLRSRIWSSHPCWKFCTNTVGLFHHHLKASAGERKVGKGEGKIHIVYCACLWHKFSEADFGYLREGLLEELGSYSSSCLQSEAGRRDFAVSHTSWTSLGIMRSLGGVFADPVVWYLKFRGRQVCHWCQTALNCVLAGALLWSFVSFMSAGQTLVFFDPIHCLMNHPTPFITVVWPACMSCLRWSLDCKSPQAASVRCPTQGTCYPHDIRDRL